MIQYKSHIISFISYLTFITSSREPLLDPALGFITRWVSIRCHSCFHIIKAFTTWRDETWAEEEALTHVFGCMVGNDVSARGLQFRTPQWLLGKALDQFLR